MQRKLCQFLSLTDGRANVLLTMGLELTHGLNGLWPPNICSLVTRKKNRELFHYLEATSESGISIKRFFPCFSWNKLQLIHRESGSVGKLSEDGAVDQRCPSCKEPLVSGRLNLRGELGKHESHPHHQLPASCYMLTFQTVINWKGIKMMLYNMKITSLVASMFLLLRTSFSSIC